MRCAGPAPLLRIAAPARTVDGCRGDHRVLASGRRGGVGSSSWAATPFHRQRDRCWRHRRPNSPLSPAERKLYTAAASARPEDAPAGYLFEVRGAPRPVNLYTAHIREGAQLGISSSYYYTRHELAPQTTSFYFVNVVSGQAIGDSRPYTLQVRARGRAEIVSVKKLDLSQWRIGLPLGMVYTKDEDGPAAGLLQDNLEVTGAFASLKELEAAAGLRLE